VRTTVCHIATSKQFVVDVAVVAVAAAAAAALLLTRGSPAQVMTQG